MDSVPSIFPSFIFCNQKIPVEIEANKEEEFPCSKYGIYEFISVIIGTLRLHLEWVLISLVYLEKLMTEAGVEIRTSNWKPLLLTWIILATKYWEEWGYWNSDFAEILDYPVVDINRMESQAISLLDYKLFISANLYSQYYFEIRALYKKVIKEETRQKEINP
jgi:hypothetical protein